MVTAIIVAAGLSRRMAIANKMLLPFGSSTVVAHTVSAVLTAGVKEVIVVVGHEAPKVKKVLEHLPVRIVMNDGYERGLSSSLQAGLAVAKGTGFMLCLADM